MLKVSKILCAGLVEEVKQHAIKHYEQGWDTLVECYDDADIQELISGAENLEEAISACAERLGISATPLSGRFMVMIQAEDGTHRKTFETFQEAVEAYNKYTHEPCQKTEEEVLGGGYCEAVSDWGQVIVLEALHPSKQTPSQPKIKCRVPWCNSEASQEGGYCPRCQEANDQPDHY